MRKLLSLGSAARRVALAAALLLSTVGKSAAQSAIAVDEKVGSSGEWRIGYSRDFAGCLTHATYTDDTTLWIGFSARFEYYIALSNPAWKSLEAGSLYKLSLRPRGARNWNGDFLAFENRGEKGLIVSGLKEEFLLDLARAASMSVHIADRTVAQVSLSGSRVALTEMLDCQKERRERSRTDAASKGDAGKGEAGKPKARSGSGTGFFVSQMGHVVTNQHVVEGCRRLDVSYAGGTPAQATLVASDTKNDLAVLMTSLVPRYVPPFRPRVRVGESIYVYGFPLSGLLASSGNFTTGNITAVAGLGDDTSKLQISAPVQPGNSGGPLLDKRGNVVGMIVEKLNVLGVAKVTNDFAQNVNFAIKASIAETFLEANGIAPPGGERSNDLDAADIAEQSKLFTVYVACNRTP